MVARVTSVAVKPEDLDESARLFDESVLPAARQEAGFMGALLLVRDDGRAIAIDLCDTIENLRANERNGFYQEQIAQVRRQDRRAPDARGLRGRGRQGRRGRARSRRESLKPGGRQPPAVQPERGVALSRREQLAPRRDRVLAVGSATSRAPRRAGSAPPGRCASARPGARARVPREARAARSGSSASNAFCPALNTTPSSTRW